MYEYVLCALPAQRVRSLVSLAVLPHSVCGFRSCRIPSPDFPPAVMVGFLILACCSLDTAMEERFRGVKAEAGGVWVGWVKELRGYG